ncbi:MULTISPECIES: GNAT family N-acetyltransferase [unclassified Myxococcus]|jgi:ribosomal-protein-alanine N-acetyltransferase|uniref:GNAT family N-acetyltransferase n=1 Tax=unclassified Myxococcus TaxID=2648731 RepID=UPI001CBA743F|nr:MULTISPECIES: GNAT family protein [unclassified Myxococcus]MBZ4400327.1 GNAT family N-acetyltransferase [Myxococcus sp. AS-1-15]MBZ4408025.1 GNAT family N-acetyltransferase [Myxococcus sp. XM-1-1-1]
MVTGAVASDLLLVPAHPEHVDFWLALRAEAGARRYVDTEDDSREVLVKRILEAGTLEEPRAKGFRWFVRLGDAWVGTVSARDVSREHGRLQIGYMMAEAYHGRGLGSRAVGMMLERLFTLPFLHRVWLTTLSENLGSQGVARKLGFSLEGTMRGHSVLRGERKDQQFWGMSRSDWEARRRG